MDTTATVNQRIWRAYVVVGLVSLLPKVALIGRELVVANRFGVGNDVDAYVMALLLPMLTINVMVHAFTSALMPIYIRRREKSDRLEANRLAGQAMGIGLMGLIAIAILIFLARPLEIPVLAASFPPDKQALTGIFLAWLVPMIPLQGASTIWCCLINAEQRFVGVGLLPLVSPILALTILFSPLATVGIQVVVWALVGGATLEAALAGVMARRAGLPMPTWGKLDTAVRLVLLRAAPLVLGMALMNCNLVVDQLFAAAAGDGNVALLNYGNKVNNALVSLAAMPVSVAVMPFFAVLVANREWGAIRRSLRFWTLVIAGVAVPGTLLLIALSPLLVCILFPSFTTQDIAAVTGIQQAWFRYHSILLALSGRK